MKILPSLLLALCMLGTNLSIQAQDAATPAPTTETQKQPSPFRGTVTAIDADENTFSIQNKDKTETKVYRISQKTTLTKEGKEAKLTDIQTGDYVRGTRLKTGEWTYDVIILKIGPKTEEEIAADQKKKEKTAMNKVPVVDPAPTATP